MGAYNGLIPANYDDPRKPQFYGDEDEDGLTAPVGAQSVPRGTIAPDVQQYPDASQAQPPQQSAVLNMPNQGAPQGAEDMSFMPRGVHDSSAGGSEAAASGEASGTGTAAKPASSYEVGGLGPTPNTYVAQPQNGNPTLAMMPNTQQDLSLLARGPQKIPQIAGVPAQPMPMQNNSDALAGLGRRPATMDDVPEAQKHHGFRKAVDIAAAIGMGAYTMNPMAGAGVFRALNHQPLTKAQETYDSKASAATGQYERSKEIQAAKTGEARVGTLEEKNRVAEERNQAYIDKLDNTFVAGTEVPASDSPTGFKAQTAKGDMKPFTPKQDRAIDYDQKAGRFTLNGSPYVPKTIEEGAALEAGLSTRYPNLAQGPYTQRWKEERKNSAKASEPKPSAELQAYSDWKSAFQTEYGREPNADEIRERKFQPKHFDVAKEQSEAAKDQELAFAHEEQRFNKLWSEAYKNSDGKPDEATLTGLKNEHESQKKNIQDAFNTRMAILKGGQQPQAAPAQAQPPAAAAPPAQQQPPVAPQPAMAVPPGVDSKGRPLAGIEQPVAPARVAPAQPQARFERRLVQQQKPNPGTVAPQQQQAQSGKPTLNKPILVAGQYHIVKGVNQSTGKPIISREVITKEAAEQMMQAQ